MMVFYVFRVCLLGYSLCYSLHSKVLFALRSSDFLHICLYPTSSTVVSGLKLNLMWFFSDFYSLWTQAIDPQYSSHTIIICCSAKQLKCRMKKYEFDADPIHFGLLSRHLYRRREIKATNGERVQNMKLYTHVSFHSWIWNRLQLPAPVPCTWIMIQNNDRPHHRMHSWLSMMATQNQMILLSDVAFHGLCAQ